jgi:hypothetical protein
MRIETRWAAGDANRLRKHADELVALAPDVILAVGSVSVGQRSSAYPVPYALETDWPVGAGRRDSNLCISKSDLLNFIPPQRDLGVDRAPELFVRSALEHL